MDPVPFEIKLIASIGAPSDLFGFSVGMDQDTIVVGVMKQPDFTGSAYIFDRSGSTWTEQDILTAIPSLSGDWFGSSLAVSGDTLAVSTPVNAEAASSSGIVYIYIRADSTWRLQEKLTDGDAIQDDQYGCLVAMSEDDTLVVGAYHDNHNGATGYYSGSAYVYIRTGTTWTFQAKLVASDAAHYHYFGISVAISGDTIVVGARAHHLFPDDKFRHAYIFIRTGSTWTEQFILSASDGVEGDLFGRSVAIDGDTVVVGSIEWRNLYFHSHWISVDRTSKIDWDRRCCADWWHGSYLGRHSCCVCALWPCE